MKISKVNHTKSAIGTRKAEHTAKGFIYDHPYQSGNKNLALEARIHDLNKNAKNLYQILNPQITYTDDEAVIKICKRFKTACILSLGTW